MKLSIRQIIGSGYAAAALLLVIMGVTAYRNIGTMRDTTQLVSQTHQMKQHIVSILSFLEDAETGQRGFVITGEDSYLEHYRTGVREVPREAASIRALTSNPAQHANLDRLDPLIAARFAEFQATIGLRLSEGFDAALRMVEGGAGEQTMDEIRAVLATMDSVENVLLAEREGAAQRSATATVAVIIGSTLAALAVVVFLAYFIMQRVSDAHDLLSREMSERGRAEGELRELTGTLQQRVEERTAELEESRIAALNMMEDAEQARRTAERTSEHLQREIAERKRAEEERARNTAELERFMDLAVGREEHMIALKQEVNELLQEAGKPVAYDLSFVLQATTPPDER